MDLKVYEKTRYQNIYRNKNNKNYVIMISKPVKTSISSFKGNKILDITTAIKVRDSELLRIQKGIEIKDKDNFDTLWYQYIDYCKKIKKLEYNTMNRKQKDYNKYLKNKINIKISKADNHFWANFIDNLECSDKQKNHIIKILKAFYNWALSDDVNIVASNPITKIRKYKVEKTEMKYWLPDEASRFFATVSNDKSSDDIETKYWAYTIYTFVSIGFSIGDRIGETRALTFDCIDKNSNVLKIKHSIEYNPNASEFLKSTKNFQSQRDVTISIVVIKIIEEYMFFLRNTMQYNVKDESMIFFNYKTKRPYSDATLRKHFYNYCNKAGVKKIRMYDLRHTFVTTMMAEGYELYHISSMLGHKSYSTTVNKYGHIRDDVKRSMAEVTDKYL